jgi:hypothetical protein
MSDERAMAVSYLREQAQVLAAQCGNNSALSQERRAIMEAVLWLAQQIEEGRHQR